MTDNTEAIERLARVVCKAVYDDTANELGITIAEHAGKHVVSSTWHDYEYHAQAILAAIRSDPIAYGIRPKPLEWTMYTPEEPAASAKSIIGNYIIDCTDTGWYVAFNGSLIVRKLDGPEAAQAAAHQCKLFVEMM